ncbi:MAG: glycosyl hydrolase, partial [Cyclobacteriaceae bacterium]|nr:glycosyl hydrolase [Cyclobacteriaceae bacterium]
RATGELVYIKPQPDADETNERYNWDAPILVSPHSPTRLYFASQRVWMSENRGDSWKAISGDLTRNQERVALPIMGKTQSWDESWDMLAMSNYNTITSLAQSPIDEGLLYAGTDDGIIQVTEDGGDNWRKIEVKSLPGVSETAFVNDIKADLYDENTVYVVLDNHKFGDLNPYVFKSTNRGKSWKSIKSNLPNRTLVWRIVQDHVKPELLFLATEFGIYFTLNAGNDWYKIKGDVPTISFRDLAIQKRENDLVAASFGRGFFVLDDYSFLRNCDKEILQKEAALFPTRKAWWYIQRPVLDFGSTRGSSGADHYVAPNPPFGAVFTYYLAEDIKTKKELRQEKEKQLAKEKSDIPFPGWKELEVERREEDPKIWLIIKDANGDVVRKIFSPAKKGFHRVAWDLKYPSKNVVRIQEQKGDEPDFIPSGAMVAPGTYTVTMSKKIGGEIITISEAIEFKVERLRKGSLEGAPPEETVAFWKELDRFTGQVSSTSIELQSGIKKVDAMKRALSMTNSNPGDLDDNLYTLKDKLMDLDEELNGNKSKQEIGEKTKTTVMQRISVARTGTAYSTYGPTPLQRQSLDVAISQHKEIREKLDTIVGVDIPTMIKALEKAGAPN